MANPQSFNRYSYVINNPLKYTDPTGHAYDDCKNLDDDVKCKRRMQHLGKVMAGWAAQKAAEIIASTVKLGFGDASCIDNPRDGCSFGLGTVVGDRQTIYTAYHVYTRATIGKTFLYQTYDGRYHTMSGVTWEHAAGTDVMVLHLPLALSSDFIPAKLNKDYAPAAGDKVSVAYKDDGTDYSGLHVLDTQIRPDDTYDRNRFFGPAVYNPWNWTTSNPYKNILNSGDSGGGVFYNGYFVGVSSYINPQDYPQGFMVFEQP